MESQRSWSLQELSTTCLLSGTQVKVEQITVVLEGAIRLLETLNTLGSTTVSRNPGSKGIIVRSYHSARPEFMSGRFRTRKAKQRLWGFSIVTVAAPDYKALYKRQHGSMTLGRQTGERDERRRSQTWGHERNPSVK